jgi:hypothetical protein
MSHPLVLRCPKPDTAAKAQGGGKLRLARCPEPELTGTVRWVHATARDARSGLVPCDARQSSMCHHVRRAMTDCATA